MENIISPEILICKIGVQKLPLWQLSGLNDSRFEVSLYDAESLLPNIFQQIIQQIIPNSKLFQKKLSQAYWSN